MRFYAIPENDPALHKVLWRHGVRSDVMLAQSSDGKSLYLICRGRTYELPIGAFVQHWLREIPSSAGAGVTERNTRRA
jgi:hypothetical protein